MKNKNYSAFPQTAFDRNGQLTTLGDEEFQGLTKREFFASKALEGLIASTDWNQSTISKDYIQCTAEYSVKLADALLEALSKP